MYNVTPHGTMGSPPSKLMFNRTIRDKIPGVQDIVGEVGESEERDRDFINKEKGKEVADKTRRATESKIQLGDKVVLKNVIFPNKLTPNFDTTVYEVIQIDGSIVKISGGGKTYLRNISHVKKISGGSSLGIESSQQLDGSEQGNGASPQAESIPDISVEPPSDAQQNLKLKLKNIGRMWQPVTTSVAESGEHTGAH